MYSTGRGKLAVWTKLLDELGLHGDEHVLDIGCGRWAMLMLAARRLPAGRAVGVDVWRRRYQSGNSCAAAERNAVLEGVSGRVEPVDADARGLPFLAASFDVVVSNLAIHNIPAAVGRVRALREAVWVLRAGGRLRIVDDAVGVLQDAGCADVTVQPGLADLLRHTGSSPDLGDRQQAVGLIQPPRSRSVRSVSALQTHPSFVLCRRCSLIIK